MLNELKSGNGMKKVYEDKYQTENHGARDEWDW